MSKNFGVPGNGDVDNVEHDYVEDPHATKDIVLHDDPPTNVDMKHPHVSPQFVDSSSDESSFGSMGSLDPFELILDPEVERALKQALEDELDKTNVKSLIDLNKADKIAEPNDLISQWTDDSLDSLDFSLSS